MPKSQYVLHPGKFRVRVDRLRQSFSIEFDDLVKLHDLPIKDCILFHGLSSYPDNYKHIFAKREDLIKVFPDSFSINTTTPKEDDDFHGWSDE